ncbi:hypothetical protein BJV74DRAFT_784855, partial [Russula compacta]
MGIDIQFKTEDNDDVHVRKATFAQQWATEANKHKQKLMETEIPEEYRRHKRVFSEEAVKALPPLQEENFSIQLKPDALNELMSKIYPLNQQE